MKVFNGSHATGTWDDVAAPGNFFINTLSSSGSSTDTPPGGSATFNGTARKFTLSNPPLTAQQLLVSVNGVIQKPNSGTSPSEGFAINGADIIFASAPATGAPHFIVTIGSSVNIGTPSNDTVGAAQIIDGSIGDAEISSSAAIAGSKISPDFGSQHIVTTGNTTTAAVNLSDNSPSLIFTDTAANNDFRIRLQSGVLSLKDDTSGTNRFTIDSNGYLTANGDLDVLGNFKVDGSVADTVIKSTGIEIEFTRAGANYINASNASGSLQLFTANSPRLVIDNTGKIGIGTTSPSTLLNLDVDTEANLGSGSEGIRLTSGSSNAQLVRLGSSYSNGSVTGPGTLLYSSNKLSLRCDNGNPITFHTGSTVAERMRIDSSGNVGIGVTSPSGPLHVYKSSGTSRSYYESGDNHTFIRLLGGSASHNSGIEFYSGSSTNTANITATSTSALQFDVGSTNAAMYINSSGSVGIGTSTPSYKLKLLVVQIVYMQ